MRRVRTHAEWLNGEKHNVIFNLAKRKKMQYTLSVIYKVKNVVSIKEARKDL
jgi:hypothetical protein